MKRSVNLGLLVLFLSTGPAAAHSSTRGFVMLLPTGYVIAGGALAVLCSFLFVTRWQSAIPRRDVPEILAHDFGFVSSLLCALLLAILIWIGANGPADPAENLLPLSIWTLWWIVIVLLHPIFGNLWRTINPFSGIHTLSDNLSRGRLKIGLVKFPITLSYWPALLIFAGFAWFQLVDPAPEDPRRLAIAVSAYCALSILATVIFGPRNWLEKADPFSIFFTQLAAASPFSRRGLRVPGAGLLDLPSLPLTGMLFVLMTLSTISFDGFANTFLWLSAISVNPLDFPGRTAMVNVNTLGLTMTFIVMASVYVVAVISGWAWSGRATSLSQALGRFVLSLIPISIAYHFAHYLGDLILNTQYLLLALNDPMGTGGNYLGLSGMKVTASFQNTASGAMMMYGLQTSGIVLGHVIAVVVAHAMARETGLSDAQVLKLEAPLATVMILYTAFGLWLLATPAIS